METIIVAHQSVSIVAAAVASHFFRSLCCTLPGVFKILGIVFRFVRMAASQTPYEKHLNKALVMLLGSLSFGYSYHDLA